MNAELKGISEPGPVNVDIKWKRNKVSAWKVAEKIFDYTSKRPRNEGFDGFDEEIGMVNK
jgi:hypothetical protein